MSFSVGPIVTLFDESRRTGASSQNGAAVEGTGEWMDAV